MNGGMTFPLTFGRKKLVNVRSWNVVTGKPSPWVLLWLPEKVLNHG